MLSSMAILKKRKIYMYFVFVEETITLSTLHATLKPWLHKLEILYSVYVKGVKEAEWLPSNYQKSSHLISVLYEAITEFDALGEFSKDIVSVIKYINKIAEQC